ncbi:MAG: hypothetical protein EPO32_00710 [Anaerolineae bacterium]|nr:MAG: hypothetical protein EPO32_00710 [Anaerolineae bacterium]
MEEMRSAEELKAQDAAPQKRKRTGLIWAKSALILVGFLWLAGEIAQPIAARRGWSVMESSRGGLAPASGRVDAIALDSEGSVWFGTPTGLVNVTVSGTRHFFDALNSGLPHSSVTALAIGSDGAVWVGTLGGLSVLRDGTWQTFSRANSRLLASDQISALAIDSQGSVWIGTTRGLSLLKSGTIIREFKSTASYRFAGGNITALAIDDADIVWTGTYVDGLRTGSQWGLWQAYTVLNSGIRDNSITYVGKGPDGSLIVGSRLGLNVLKADRSWEFYSPENSGLADQYVRSALFDYEGNLWVLGFFTLSRRHTDGSWETYNSTNSVLSGNKFHSLALGSDGRVWIGTDRGLAILEPAAAMPWLAEPLYRVRSSLRKLISLVVVLVVAVKSIQVTLGRRGRRLETPLSQAREKSTESGPFLDQLARRANAAYNWIKWISLITVPWMIYAQSDLNSRSSLLDWAWAGLVPASLHLLLLPRATRDSSLFVRRHTQQALMLVALRAATTVWLIGLTRGDGFPLWLLVNGTLWMWGSTRGKLQVKRGECWLMRRRGEVHLLPTANGHVEFPSTPVDFVPADVKAAWDQAGRYLQAKRPELAKKHYLIVFREGPPAWRARAIEALRKLGEVETM